MHTPVKMSSRGIFLHSCPSSGLYRAHFFSRASPLPCMSVFSRPGNHSSSRESIWSTTWPSSSRPGGMQMRAYKGVKTVKTTIADTSTTHSNNYQYCNAFSALDVIVLVMPIMCVFFKPFLWRFIVTNPQMEVSFNCNTTIELHHPELVRSRLSSLWSLSFYCFQTLDISG